jgi:DNA-binding transcriptional regulator YhcF (GntR family)
MQSEIQIKDNSSIPKYKQLINEFLRLIRAKKLKLGDKIPSLTEITDAHNISRDTVVAAYSELKNRGIISSRHGKGYYISSTAIKSKLKIFMLFDVMNGYKEILFQSIVNNLGPDYHVDLFFHYYNLKVFEQLIHNNLNNYGYFIVMPHFNEDVSKYITPIPKDKLLIIDKDIEAAKFVYNAVYQDFENDVINILNRAQPLFLKYKVLKYIANHNFQFIPEGIINGFSRFCKENKLESEILEKLKPDSIHKGDAFMIMSDTDLITLIKHCEKNGWHPGKEIGIISYDETPLKEVLATGITVISTDFVKMGYTASQLIKGSLTGKIQNPPLFIKRNSL